MMTRRKGLSLTEVLVAIFTCAIGLVALMSLFPVGAVNMAQAIKDDRTAQAASAADAYMRWYWRNHYYEINYKENAFVGLTNPNLLRAYGNNSPANVPIPRPGAITLPGTETGASYPVVVDPIGYVAPWSPASQKYWVGNYVVPRRSLDEIVKYPEPLALRVCSLLDGYTFDESGRPNTSSSTGQQQVEREYRYNWLWVIQQTNANNRDTANMTVVVFDRRAFKFVPPDAERIHTPIAAAIDSTSLKFPANDRPNVIRGGWIADVTTVTTVGTLPYNVRNFNFYRVVSITDNPNDGSVDIELQVPLKKDTVGAGAITTPPLPATERRFLVMAGVSEVFDRGYLSAKDD